MKRIGLPSLPTGVTPERVVGELHNDQIVWDVCRKYQRHWWGKRSGVLDSAQRFFSPRGQRGTPAQLLAPFDPLDEWEDPYNDPNPARHQPFPPAAVTPALMRALEDPARWVAAHVLLTRIHGTTDHDGNPRGSGGPLVVQPLGGGGWVYTFDGLRVGLRPAGPEYDWTDDVSDAEYWRVTPCAATADPAQWPAIRDQWHRRLDVPIGSVPWWRMTAAAGVLPVWWVAALAARAFRSQSRRRSTRCPACGYDLRATPGRCPECGTVPDGPARPV